MGGPGEETRPHIRAEMLNTAIQCWQEQSVRPRITAEVLFDVTAVQAALDGVGQGVSNVGKVVVRVAA